MSGATQKSTLLCNYSMLFFVIGICDCSCSHFTYLDIALNDLINCEYWVDVILTIRCRMT